MEVNVKKTIWIIALAMCTAGLSSTLSAKSTGTSDVATDPFPDAQAQVRKRLNDIWINMAAKDLAKQESFHLYGPKFTEFKDGQPRGDAEENKELIGALTEPKVEMKDLSVAVYGDTAIATFNGDFSGKIGGKPIAMKQGATMVFVRYRGDWKIVHEHFSPILPPQGGPPGK
jgi:hypothetical protein